MKNRTFQIKLLATLILASACISGCTANEKKLAETDKDGFVSIFDGKTLKGWEALPADTAPAWTVKDGMIVGDGDKGQQFGIALFIQSAGFEVPAHSKLMIS